MTELNDIAKENDVNLEECIVFVRGSDDILAVDISNVKIRQRSDDTMGITFSISPKQTLNLILIFHKLVIGLFIIGVCLQSIKRLVRNMIQNSILLYLPKKLL